TPFEVGILTCTLSGAPSRSANEAGHLQVAVCQFRPGNSGAEETYVGSAQSAGLPGAAQAGRVVMLVVQAAARLPIAPGMLEQTYAAEASTNTGNDKQAPLVGQRQDRIALRAEVPENYPTMALTGAARPLIMTLELKVRTSPA